MTFPVPPLTQRATVVALVLLATACSGDDTADPAPSTVAATTVASSDVATAPTTEATTTTVTPATTVPPDTTVAIAPATTDPPATTAPVATTAVPTLPEGTSAEELVRALADDALDGRDNQTIGSDAARVIILDELSTLSDLDDGIEGVVQPFDQGSNVLLTLPGTDLADEYVVVGAHYDHLGECRNATPEDQICNGAADNATGVAAALRIARAVASQPTRRSVIIALWDAEEDGLLGATHYVNQPIAPLAQTVAYVNFDLIGSNLLPSLSNLTLAIGAETGGSNLLDATATAASAGGLDVASLSLVFGQGRSDHAPFAAAAVPIVFFGDATNGCYHTVDDEPEQVDFAKLDQQIVIGTSLVLDLANTDSPPVFDDDAPITRFDDVVAIRDLLVTARADLDRLGPDGDAAVVLLEQLEEVVAGGPDGFDADDIGVLLAGTAGLVEALAAQPCP